VELLPALQGILSGLGLHTDVNTFLVFFGLALARLLTAVSLAPFLGGPVVPRQVRVGLAVVITALLYNNVTAGAARIEISPVLFVALLVKEALIGATIGFLSQLVFFGVQMAGTLIDTQRGMNQITFLAPQLQGHTSALGSLKFQAALVLFLALNGHLIFLRALARSYHVLPLTEFPHFHAGATAMLTQVARLSADALVIAVQLAAPVLLALFLLDVAFACLGKVASQVNVHHESQPVKALAGLAIVFFVAAFLLGQLQTYFGAMIRSVENIMKGFV
jgi:flagellar biosynthetic protein FliR